MPEKEREPGRFCFVIATACWLVLLQTVDAGADPPRPNILILMAEDMGPRVGAFGDPVAVTPHIDQLAAQGVRYPSAFTTAGVCAPSRAAMITGIHQAALGAQHMRSHQGGYRAVPPPEVKAYPELLRAAGYYTFTNLKLDYQFSGVLAGSGPFTIWDREGRLQADWRGRDPGQPFFGLVNLHATHESAIFPRSGFPKSGTHLLFQLVYAVTFWGHGDVVAPEAVQVPPYYPDTPTVRRDIARHYNNIHKMDEEVGAVLAALDRDRLSDNTVVIWTADHGDGLPRAKRELFDSGIHVPMIVRWPDALRPTHLEPGSEDARLVSFVDLAPTVLAMAGLPASEYMVGRDLTSSNPEDLREFIYAARDRIDEAPDRQRAVRDHRFKYIRNDRPGQPGARHSAFRQNLDIMEELWALWEGRALDAVAARWFEPRPREELYDTWTDPHELVNLAEDPAQAVPLRRLRRALDVWIARTEGPGVVPEAEMAQRFWPGGVEPITPPPSVDVRRDDAGRVRVTLACSEPGASLGYRVGGDRWQVYTTPLELSEKGSLTAKAVRYGWRESDEVTVALRPGIPR
jgi:arylsulfatase A-like enzyme